MYWVKVLVRLQSPIWKWEKKQKFNMQMTIVHRDGGKTCMNDFEEAICTGICRELKRYNFNSTSYIAYMASASCRKMFGTTECCCSVTKGSPRTWDSECSKRKNLQPRQDQLVTLALVLTIHTNYLRNFEKKNKKHAEAPNNRLYLN